MDDLISRQAAIDALTRLANDPWNQETNATWASGFSEAAYIIENLPSAQKTGAWIKMSDSDGIYYACSQCGDDIPRSAHFKPQYCPNCGAKMEDDNG